MSNPTKSLRAWIPNLFQIVANRFQLTVSASNSHANRSEGHGPPVRSEANHVKVEWAALKHSKNRQLVSVITYLITPAGSRLTLFKRTGNPVGKAETRRHS